MFYIIPIMSTDTLILKRNIKDKINTFIYIYNNDDKQYINDIHTYLEPKTDLYSKSNTAYIIFVGQCTSVGKYNVVPDINIKHVNDMICCISISNRLSDIKVKYVNSTYRLDNKDDYVLTVLIHRKIEHFQLSRIIARLIESGSICIDDVIVYLICNRYTEIPGYVYKITNVYSGSIKEPNRIIHTAILKRDLVMIDTICNIYIRDMHSIVISMRDILISNVHGDDDFFYLMWDILLCHVNAYSIHGIISDMIIIHCFTRSIRFALKLLKITGWSKLQYSVAYGSVVNVKRCIHSGCSPHIYNCGTPSPLSIANKESREIMESY